MQVIAIPHLLESASADFVGVVAVLTAEPFIAQGDRLVACFLTSAVAFQPFWRLSTQKAGIKRSVKFRFLSIIRKTKIVLPTGNY